MTEKIPITDFAKLDLRVGEIKKAGPHPNADKLFVLTVDLGEETERTIVAGIKGYYKEEELAGKKAIFITNLAPVKLRGVESNGMILAACTPDNEKVVFLQPEKDVPIGTKVS